VKVGDVKSWARTFTAADIELFNRVSGDQGVQHVTPDEQGRLMVHGLLTATIPTKLGGDMNFISREMLFQFHRPVFAGDTIHCEVTIVEFAPSDLYDKLKVEFDCRNQNGKQVMTGHAVGVVRHQSPAREI
jgi:3-hydroxybutyryl-CoA dehydratase